VTVRCRSERESLPSPYLFAKLYNQM
jgi:hypothetical protein